MAIYEVTPELYQLGQQYYHQGMEQLDRVAYDERDAKTAVLAGFVMSTAVLLSGAPGGGKSLLSRYAHRVFEDISDDEIAVVPPDSQLQPVQLVGGLMQTTKTIDDGYNAPRTTTSGTRVEGIVKPNTKTIWLDELTRINPWALNDLLGAPEEHELKTTAGTIPLEDLHILISTMNPSETRQATFKVSAAFASRHSVGAIMGHDLSEESAIKLVQGMIPDADKVEPIATTNQLRRLREAVNNTLLPESEAKRVVRAVGAIKQELRDRYNIVEADRMAVQLGKTTRTLALFNGLEAKSQEVNKAVRLTLGARIGALVAGNSFEELEKTTEAVLARID